MWNLATRCGATALRTDPMVGVVGFDWPAVMAAAAALGVAPDAVARLLPAIELGLLAARRGRGGTDG